MRKLVPISWLHSEPGHVGDPGLHHVTREKEAVLDSDVPHIVSGKQRAGEVRVESRRMDTPWLAGEFTTASVTFLMGPQQSGLQNGGGGSTITYCP